VKPLIAIAAVLPLALTACSSKPPAPDWAGNAKSASEQAVAAYLVGNTRIEAAALARARSEVGRTGRPDLLARVELTQCAAQVASLVFGPCAGFEAVRADAAPPERAYADYLLGRATPADAARLPEAQRAFVANSAASLAPSVAALNAIADPLARLVAAGVLFETSRAEPALIAAAADTASAQGWRRPLLAWLGVQLKLAEERGAADEAGRLRRRLALASEAAPAASAPPPR
jgi:hypothetical protein